MKFKIAYDKKLHFLVCFGITLLLYPVFGWWSIGTSIATGVGKELYDWRDYGLFSWSDIMADMTGIVVGIIVILLIKIIML